MRYISKLVDYIDDELCGARKYAEKYLEYKAGGNALWAAKYKEMAADELKHATYLHEMATEEIKKLRAIYTPPEDMLEKWERVHTNYIEKDDFIKSILEL